ncbi:unnamed protein product [Brassica oleracea var. botrytis]|uniref:Uncharacterized protein n=2 Tax=Brassica TaxID=3705 RepID=A0A3P6H5Q5_BRAOL|nr:unnamed protein product [Brassica napus]CDY38585.1 BnaC06g30080D [Brassica napus]VDD63825.1 unnamed protein product [Brassica oleracea]
MSRLSRAIPSSELQLRWLGCGERWSAWAFVVVRESPEPNSLSVAACWFGVFPSTEFGFSGFGRMSLPLPQDRVVTAQPAFFQDG